MRSAEKGSMVAMAVAEIASGNSLPFCICPPKNYWDYFFARGPDDNYGCAKSQRTLCLTWNIM